MSGHLACFLAILDHKIVNAVVHGRGRKNKHILKRENFLRIYKWHRDGHWGPSHLETEPYPQAHKPVTVDGDIPRQKIRKQKRKMPIMWSKSKTF